MGPDGGDQAIDVRVVLDRRDHRALGLQCQG
jgi:hypothetical protein